MDECTAVNYLTLWPATTSTAEPSTIDYKEVDRITISWFPEP